MLVYFFLLITDSLARRRVNLHIIAGGAVELFPQRFGIIWAIQHYSDWVCTAVMSNDVMKDLRG